MNDLDRMKELIHTLNEAGKAYYQQNKEVMSNLEYDKMYDELLELEKKDEHCFIKQSNDPCRV